LLIRVAPEEYEAPEGPIVSLVPEDQGTANSYNAPIEADSQVESTSSLNSENLSEVTRKTI